ncbi:4Fe-4S dicluster domain-containing protein [Dethiobacter alkaliphilus]|uniref:4Fe-4S dicluster domain-containing protein n=1 Tax=Dethiobacter alkaliphilus TaxID=427926 RepID=UPI0022266991|nr:4Fe-4S dicluster domain-containing protein [Dethiobacter alkaliphilus]MCW3489251.1 4Fe-4S dicluster domain-containing protein [Dethiobacter alkaliphilus]
MKEIYIDHAKCNGCLMCMQACSAEHSESQTIPGALAEKTASRIFVHTANGKPTPVMCRHCEEPACVDACMSGAMQKDPETGIVTNEGTEQDCAGCWMCIMSCPYGVINQDNSGSSPKAMKCDLCKGKEPACVSACPNNALFIAEPTRTKKKQKKQKQPRDIVKIVEAC